MSDGSVMGQILTAQSTHPQDPYFYFPRVSSIAKFVINAGNDDFFVPDNTKEWWQAVPGPKWSLALAISRHLWLLHIFFLPVALRVGVVRAQRARFTHAFNAKSLSSPLRHVEALS